VMEELKQDVITVMGVSIILCVERGDWFVYLYVAKFGTGHMLQGTDLKLSPMSTCSCVEIRTAGEDIEGQAIHQYF
jgi:hypothetical protein